MSSESHAVNWAETTERPRFINPTDAFESVHDLLGRKWHLRIVYHLLEGGPLGFSDLKGSVEGVSSKMLSESLSSLDDHGLVAREIVSDQPVRVEYSLTERGRALEPAVAALVRWESDYGLATGDA
jgi:DNA-binding HxlR family transcriptional regulator